MKFPVQSHFVTFGLSSLLVLLSACDGSLARQNPERELLLQKNSEPSGNDLRDVLSTLDVEIHSARYYVASGGLKVALKTVQYENGELTKESRVTNFCEKKSGDNILNIYTRIDGERFIINARVNGTMSGIAEFRLAEGDFVISGTPEECHLEENTWVPIYYRCFGKNRVEGFSLNKVEDIATAFDHAIMVMARREPLEKSKP